MNQELLFLASAMLASFTPHASAQYSGWQHEGSLFILTAPDGADLPDGAAESNFPLLVRLNKGYFDFSQTNPKGNDLWFSAGGKPLVYQIEAWDSAKGFCKWLSKKTGRTASLPTEAQREYACRAGTTTAFSFGDDPDDLAQYGHFSMDGWDGAAHQSPQFAPVGSFKPNPWGLYDMHGNLYECCEDYISTAYSPDDKLDPKVLTPSNRRVAGVGANPPTNAARPLAARCAKASADPGSASA